MEKLAVVVDTNVVFAALVRSEGLNRYVVTILPAMFPFFYPSKLKEEIFKHIRKISLKAGLKDTQVIFALQSILSGMRLVPTQRFAQRKQEALNLVKDSNDWAYVALALYLRQRYENVLILTWNKKHFAEDKLKREGIILATPEELLKALKLRYQRGDKVESGKVSGVLARIYYILISVTPEEK